MRLSRRTNTIILWVISLGLLLGMIITFTPTLGGNLFGGNGGRVEGSPELLVNGQAISDLDLARIRQQSGSLAAFQEGEAGEDIDLLLLDTLIERELLRQAAASIRVSSGDVRQAVNDFREQQGVAGSRNDDAYLRLINNIGYDDQGFRELLRQNLRLQSYQESIVDAVEVTDAEAEAFYELNRDAYRSDERIMARMIVVDDPELAADLRERVEAGEGFADLAAEYSLERADREGALGAPADSTEPQPVGRAALPTAVSNAAFGLGGAGVTDVVEAAGRYYLVAVEELRPAATRPYAEVADQVREDALAAKQQQVLEAEIDRLRAQADIVVPEGSTTVYRDAVVARVGDTDIHHSDLARATWTNPQIQQALSPQNAVLITEFFKPTFLENLISLELAYQGAQELDASFLGSHDQVAQAALSYVTRDAEASEDEIAAYYEENRARYTVPASATVTRVEFADAESASAFRGALLAGAELAAAAEAAGGDVTELGSVGPGVLDEAVLDAALFGTDAFEPLPDGTLEVSDVLVLPAPAPEPVDEGAADAAEPDTAVDATPDEADADATPDEPDADATPDEAAADATGDDAAPAEADADQVEPEVAAPVQDRFVVLVAERTPERVRPLEEVRSDVENAVLSAERAELRNAWLDELRERIPVENLVAQAPPADDAAEEAPAEETPTGEDAAPTEETPNEETPTGEDAAPTEETPTEESPTEESPAGEETPTEESPTAPAGD